jgi:hypothetical protein
MNTQTLDTDYLIVGSGAVGMAFADVILSETSARVMFVDRHALPGGHWNDAYPFVRLHQPSAFYGVNSRVLGSGGKDATGLNTGMCERASSAEVLSYFEQVMQGFLATGRVSHFAMSTYLGNYRDEHSFQSLTSGDVQQVRVHKKVVDATYLNTAVPSTHPPKYAIAPGLKCVPPNELPRIKTPPSGYVVVGSGKTGIDACIWLLENGAKPDSIRWIMPRDAWYLNRANVQPGMEFFEQSYGALARQVEAVAQASSVDDLMTRLNAAEVLLRLDDTVMPSMYHGAIISRSEIALLKSIKGIVRLGRVQAIEPHRIVLERAELPTDPDVLYVDCSASAVQRRPLIKVFDGNRITPQFVRPVQPTFSAALIAHIEANFEDDAEKNQICTVVPLPDAPIDWLVTLGVGMMNQQRWSKVKGLSGWITRSRLDGFSAMAGQIAPDDNAKIALLQRFRENAGPAMMNAMKLMATR